MSNPQVCMVLMSEHTKVYAHFQPQPNKHLGTWFSPAVSDKPAKASLLLIKLTRYT